MREQELIVYRTFEDGELLRDMAGLMSYFEKAEGKRKTQEEAGAEELRAKRSGAGAKAGGLRAGQSGAEAEAEDLRQARGLLYDCIHRLVELAGVYGFHGNLWHCYLVNLLVNNENSYSWACEIRGEIEGTINDAVLHDMEIFKEFYDYDFGPLCESLHVREFSMIETYCHSDESAQRENSACGAENGISGSIGGTDNRISGGTGGNCSIDGNCPTGRGKEGGTGRAADGPGRRRSTVYNARICGRICELAEKFSHDHTAQEMKADLTRFYKEYGVGKFGLHKAFRIVHGDGLGEGQSGVCIEPIRNIAHVSLDDLVGYELAKQKLIDNTEAFVAGRKANNCLLYGDAGTGKSSCIKAIANQYYDRGLRIIEIYKHQFQDLNQVISQIKNRNYKFIIYMDDLSFEEFEIEYKYLKAVIEGGLERKPDNVLIYATSNRRHLIKENYGDKEEIRQDMHTGDTVQEKLSLVSRFGVTIYFGAPDKKQFQGIVKALAQKCAIQMPEEELLLRANQWELSHGGLSGRTAQQFIDYLAGTEL